MIHTRDIVWFEPATSFVGTSDPELKADGESPKRPVKLAGFGVAKRTVSNEEFAKFVTETGYVTEAEKFEWSYVFKDQLTRHQGPQPAEAPWWNAVDGACWHSPIGPGSGVSNILDHPAVHMSGNDAAAYALWAGGRLPSEAEWEHAARGGNTDSRYPWGDTEPDDTDNLLCNIWQGEFPDGNTGQDGYFATSPCESFGPNRAGIYNMSGNVWEWTSDRFRIRSVSFAARRRNRQAAAEDESILKGGSFLCHRSYCWRYRIAARSGRSKDTSASHTGFRVAFDFHAR